MQVSMLARLYCKAISAALFQTLDSAVVEKPTVVRGGVADVTGGAHLGEEDTGLLGKSIPAHRGSPQ